MLWKWSGVKSARTMNLGLSVQNADGVKPGIRLSGQAAIATMEKGKTMKDNIMYFPSIVLMVVEAGALIFLITEWIKAKRKNK